MRRLFNKFTAARQGGAAIEFAISGIVLFGFLLAIIDLGLLGLSVGALARGVQATGRWATVQASSSYASSSSSISEPCFNRDAAAFNSFVTPLLPALGTAANASASSTETTGNLTLTVAWTNGGTGSTGTGLYMTLTGSYNWQPLGFSLFAKTIALTITTAATVVGSSTSSVTVNSSCS